MSQYDLSITAKFRNFLKRSTMNPSMHRNQSFNHVKHLGSYPDSYFTKGIVVKVVGNKEYVKFVQSQIYGWDDRMSECLNKAVIVKGIDFDKGIRVATPDNKTWIFSRSALACNDDSLFFNDKASLSMPTNWSIPTFSIGKNLKNSNSSSKTFKVGDLVVLSTDEEFVKNRQDTVGGYSRVLMKPLFGKTLKVICVRKYTVTAERNQISFDYHPDVLTLKNDVEAQHEEDHAGSLESSEVFEAIATANVDNLYTYLTEENLNERKDDGCTPLNATCIAGNIDILKSLLEFEPDFGIPDLEGKYPVHNCILYGNEDLLKHILETYPDEISRMTTCKSSLLHLAVAKRRGDLVSYLVEKGISQNLRNNRQLTAYDEALLSRDDNIISLLEKPKVPSSVQPPQIQDFSLPSVPIDKSISQMTMALQVIPYVRPQIDRTIPRYDLECPICFENIRDRVLKCGHSACENCIDQIIICWMCREPIDRADIRRLYNN